MFLEYVGTYREVHPVNQHGDPKSVSERSYNNIFYILYTQ
jgi:hypothetical protein